MKLLPVLFAVVVIAAASVKLAVVVAQSQPQKQPPACVDAKSKDQIRELTLRAIDQGFQAHVATLFTVWTRDYSPEPTRAMVGMANGISAWKRARSNALNWDPPSC